MRGSQRLNSYEMKDKEVIPMDRMESQMDISGEKRRRRIGVRMAAAFAMLLVILSMLISSFQLVIYGDSKYRFYEREYEKYTVTEALGMELKDVMHVTEYMMDYLIGKEDELSIVTTVEGKEQDFFNEQDRLHMADVRNLFLGGLKLRRMCLVTAAVLILILILLKADWKYLIPRAYSVAVGVFLGIVALLAIAFSIDFTRCFTIFHQIFFTNDLWLFDPETDYMIRMLPEGFFSDMVIRIGLTFILMLALLWVVLMIWRIVEKRKRYN